MVSNFGLLAGPQSAMLHSNWSIDLQSVDGYIPQILSSGVDTNCHLKTNILDFGYVHQVVTSNDEDFMENPEQYEDDEEEEAEAVVDIVHVNQQLFSSVNIEPLLFGQPYSCPIPKQV